MTLIVTGTGGFVGRHFCSRYGGSPLQDKQGTVDLRDAARVRSAVQALSPDAVLHLAAQSSVTASFEDPRSTFSVNFSGTLNLLEALADAGFRGAFVYVGSADVYGTIADADLPARETQPLRPRSPYAVSKVAAEALCYQWSQTGPFRIVLARPFTQIGPGQLPRFAVAGFAQQIAQMRRGSRPAVLITGDLEITRDFTDVRDTIRAYQILLEHGKNGEIYNICSGEERKLRTMVEDMVDIAGIQIAMQVSPDRLRPTEQRRMRGDSSRMHALGWAPQIPMRTTLTDILRTAEEAEDEQ